jgi:hypothetical protein
MVDYACARTLDYIDSLGNGGSFTVAGVNDDFFNGTSARFPIPFTDVMIATFMLEGLRGAVEVQGALAALKVQHGLLPGTRCASLQQAQDAPEAPASPWARPESF